jgi:hypothetical protein
MKHCTISGIINHGDQGYGFKLTFLSIKDAQHAKKQISNFLEHGQDYILTVREAYHDD